MQGVTKFDLRVPNAGQARPHSLLEETTMKRFAVKLLVTAAALALFAVGCSKKPASLTSPVGGPGGVAPLIGHSAAGLVVPGSYIVVFKSGTGPVDGLVNELAARHGFLARFRYHTAVHGFAGMLTPTALAELRGDPRVAYVEENQQVHADVVQ